MDVLYYFYVNSFCFIFLKDFFGVEDVLKEEIVIFYMCLKILIMNFGVLIWIIFMK